MDTPTPPLASSAGDRSPADEGLCFALVVYPETLARGWRARLLPAAANASSDSAGPGLEFSTPLDLVRHLAALPAGPVAFAGPHPTDARPARPASGGLR